MNIVYTKYDPKKHLNQLVELEQNLWKDTTNDELKKIFSWKYPVDTPLKNAFVALDGDRLIAFRGFFINTYQLNGGRSLWQSWAMPSPTPATNAKESFRS